MSERKNYLKRAYYHLMKMEMKMLEICLFIEKIISRNTRAHYEEFGCFLYVLWIWDDFNK